MSGGSVNMRLLGRQRTNMLTLQDSILVSGKVVAVIERDGKVIRTIEGRNIVTNDGDKHYAQMICGETPDDDFDHADAGIRLGTGTTAVAKTDTDVTTFATGAAKALSASFPATDDSSTGNTGGGVDIVTWKYAFSAGDFTATGIAEGAIVDNRTTPTAALCHFLFAAAFDITSIDALTVYVNHTFTGA
jgi:hypothetical protein